MKWSRHDQGNVIVEFIGVTVALLIPISIIANASIVVANAYLATEVSARTAARAYVVSSNDASGTRAAANAARLLIRDFDSRDTNLRTHISCTRHPCLSPGGFVTVRVSKQVRLDLPRIFGARQVSVSSQHSAVVDEMRN